MFIMECETKPLTLALGATATALRPRAFRLPTLLVGGAPLFASCKCHTSHCPFTHFITSCHYGHETFSSRQPHSQTRTHTHAHTRTHGRSHKSCNLRTEDMFVCIVLNGRTFRYWNVILLDPTPPLRPIYNYVCASSHVNFFVVVESTDTAAAGLVSAKTCS